MSTALSRFGSRAGRALAIALVFLVALTGAATLAPAAAHADEVGISTVPAGADGKADGRTRFSYELNPGQQVKDTFLVSNTGTTEQTFTVVGTDAFNDAQGDYALLPTSQQPTGVGTWVHFADGSGRISFPLAPGASRAVPFTLEIPADATPGDHVGGLLASVVTPGAEVSLDRRVATRLYARVAGQLQPMLTVASISADWGGDWWNPFDGSVTLHYVVKNTGNIALAANTTAAVHTWLGVPVGTTVSSPLAELLPGSAAAVDVPLTGIAQWGFVNPGVTVSPFVQTQDAALGLPAPVISRDTFVFTPPWVFLILVGLGVGVFFLVRWWRRRQEARAQAWLEYMEEQNQAAREDELVAPAAGTAS
ncbi:MAG: hypothetical protein CMH36_10305 [Microbacterium sp.]|uniref:DUF916 domain-containing protein n=1 Tax=Microbacterium ginsengisoli TaxID=400772 RepID=A0A3C1KGZ9_9MICO|nr:hypothetical protein [Microbacterium ginsengisoli]MAL07202.1 hypothetical protein [Microbacterium sp.]MBN9209086.1 hypothetical protein [Microbacterium ginsengisoli]HAN25718.1 hypothetical protein [Microbacterium ginsengisoli]